MFTHKSTHPRFWASLFLILHVMALLLPANAATAAALAAGSCAAQRAQAAAPAIVVPASADQSVVIPNRTITAAIFQANWLANYQNVERLRSIIEGALLMKLPSKDGPEGLEAAHLRWVKRVEEKIVYNNLHDTSHAFDETIHVYLDEALKEPELATYVPEVWSDLTRRSPLRRDLTPATIENIAQSTERYDLGERMLALAPQWIIEVHDCAQKNPQFAKFFDVYNLDKLGVSIGDDAKTILEKKPNLPIPAPIRQQIAADGTVAISLNELKALGQSEMEKLNATIDDMQKTVKDIDERQKVIVDYLSNQAEKARLQELARKKDAEYKLQLEAAQASISIITAIANEIDPKFAKKFNVVASSALTIGKSIKDWLSATAGLDGLDKVFSLSTVVMTGNIVGAVSNIFGIFGEDEPTPEEVILEEIGKLRQQVDQLRTEMHERFDRIDEGLNAIYTTMHERFHQIDIQLGKINGNIIEVQQALAGLDVKLSRIERNNFELINAVSRRPLLEAVNGGLGYRQRTGQPMTQAQFAQFENQFHSWATLHAFDPGNVGPTQRDYNDAALLNELTTYPIDANLNYINGWLVTHGFPAISNKPLPSPRDWLLASRAYTQLGLEEPEQMAAYLKNDPQRQVQLEQIGLEVEAAMQRLSTLTTSTSTQGNNLLFSTVITYYQEKADGLEAAIQTLENNFIEEVRTQRLGHSGPLDIFDLYAGPYQSLINYRTPEEYNITCSDAARHGSYPTPIGGLFGNIPNFHLYNLADYLKVGKFAYCLSDEWANPVEVCKPKTPGGPIICETFANHKAFLTVYYDARPLVIKMVHDGVQLMPAERAGAWTKDNWMGGLEYRTAFATQSFVVPPTPEMEQTQIVLATAVKSLVEQRLAGFQQELYGRILNEMNKGSLKTVADELAGIKLLLDNLVSLGLPRAMSNSEFLHAMLYGEQQLVDSGRLMHAYSIHFTQPITLAIQLNPRTVLGETTDQRSAALVELINEYLAAITAKEHVEAPDYIANTRRALNMTMRVVAVEAATQAQTINFSPLPDKLVGDAPFTLNASASSGLPVSFAALTPAVCTVSAPSGLPTVTLVTTGTCILEANQGGNANFKPAPPVTQALAVKSPQKSEQTISFTQLADQQLGTPPLALSATASSSLAVSFTSLTPAVCRVDGNTVTLRTAGLCTLVATQEGNATINPATPVTQRFTVTNPGSGGVQKLYLPVVTR